METLDYVYKSVPYAHQHEHFLLSRDKEYWAILFEMGCGKSKVAIDSAAWLYSLGRINCFVVLAPNGVHKKWLLEDIPFSLPDHIEYEAAVWEAGNKKSMDACEKLLRPGNHLRVFFANSEGLSYAKLPAFLSRLLNATDTLFVVDESTRFKNPTSGRTKALMKLKNLTKYRRILAGDAVLNSPFDLFSQIGFLDEDVLGHSYPAFKAEHAEMLSPTDRLVVELMRKNNLRFPPQIPATNPDGSVRYKNLDKLKSRIAHFSSRVTKAEAIDLPPKIYSTRYFKMPPKHRAMYDRLASEFLYEMNDVTIGVTHKLTLALRLQQLTSGFISDGNGGVIDLYADDVSQNPRIQLLNEVIEEIDGQIIIWCAFVDDIRNIVKSLGKENVATYFGEDSPTAARNNLDAFRRGEKRFFVGTAKKGGIGLNIVNAATAIYYSNTFNFGDRGQSEDRCHRIGQTSDKVVYIDIEAEDSYDQKIVASLRKKKNLSAYMLDLSAHGAPLL